jgi:hypothetical protein
MMALAKRFWDDDRSLFASDGMQFMNLRIKGREAEPRIRNRRLN